MEYIDGEYVLTNKISNKNIKEMRANMDETDVEAFDKFIQENWGTNIIDKNEKIEEKPKRGRKPKQTV